MASNIIATGASGKTAIIYQMPDNDGFNSFVNDIIIFNSEMNKGVINSTMEVVYLPSQEGEVKTDKPLIGIVNSYQLVTINGQYKYIVVSGSKDETDTMSTASITSQDTTVNDNVVVIGGNKGGFNYDAGDESGTIYNTTGPFTFYNYHKTGSWTIKTATGDANITTTTGNNSICVGSGKANIDSRGLDDISVNFDDPTLNYISQVTLRGGNSTISSGQGTSIYDVTSNNVINTYQNTTVSAGTSGTITFTGAGEEVGGNTVQGGIGNTISSNNTNVTAIHGTDNTFSNITENLSFLNGDGNTNVSISKRFSGFGADGLNLTLKSNDVTQSMADQSLFIAGSGNETLNASGYNNSIQIFADTTAGANSHFTVAGGSGDDTLAAGTGNSTFTGGTGDNLFMFTKNSVDNGSTTIRDFAHQGSNNHIGLYGYGLNNDSLTQLIDNAHNNTVGYATLTLDNNHTITLQDVSVADLKVSQFSI